VTYEIKYTDTQHPNWETISSVRQFNKDLKAGHVVPGSAFKRAKQPVFPYPLCAGKSFQEYASECEANRLEIEAAEKAEAKWNADNPWIKI
jgi:hypothetical protein